MCLWRKYIYSHVYLLTSSIDILGLFFVLLASPEQIDAAKEMLKKLQFTYTAESFENPVLQKHWRNIEALALDRDAPEEMVDYTRKSYPVSCVVLILQRICLLSRPCW